MTRANTKKIRETLNGLIEHISNSCVVQDTNLFELSIQDSQCLIWSDLHEEQNKALPSVMCLLESL